MKVKKRNGELVEVSFDKILYRIKRIGEEEGIKINYSLLVMKIIEQLQNKMQQTYASSDGL